MSRIENGDQIVLSEILPRISYLTLMNGFLNMSFFFVCASVLVSLRASVLDRQGKTAPGDRVDRRCRWLFPLPYVGLLLIAVGATGVVVSERQEADPYLSRWTAPGSPEGRGMRSVATTVASQEGP